MEDNPLIVLKQNSRFCGAMSRNKHYIDEHCNLGMIAASLLYFMNPAPTVRKKFDLLRSDVSEFLNSLRVRKRIPMSTIPKNELAKGWDLTSIFERTQTAQMLGFSVELHATEQGLEFVFVKNIPKNLTKHPNF